jgi:hypothetical protein
MLRAGRSGTRSSERPAAAAPRRQRYRSAKSPRLKRESNVSSLFFESVCAVNRSEFIVAVVRRPKRWCIADLTNLKMHSTEIGAMKASSILENKLGRIPCAGDAMTGTSRRSQLIILKNDLLLAHNRAERADLERVVALMSEAISIISSQLNSPRTAQADK